MKQTKEELIRDWVLNDEICKNLYERNPVSTERVIVLTINKTRQELKGFKAGQQEIIKEIEKKFFEIRNNLIDKWEQERKDNTIYRLSCEELNNRRITDLENMKLENLFKRLE